MVDMKRMYRILVINMCILIICVIIVGHLMVAEGGVYVELECMHKCAAI